MKQNNWTEQFGRMQEPTGMELRVYTRADGLWITHEFYCGKFIMCAPEHESIIFLVCIWAKKFGKQSKERKFWEFCKNTQIFNLLRWKLVPIHFWAAGYEYGVKLEIWVSIQNFQDCLSFNCFSNFPLICKPKKWLIRVQTMNFPQ